MDSRDTSAALQARIQAAVETRTPLCITGGNSKAFYGREPVGEPLSILEHRGIISYEPTELVITARAGTPLMEIEAALAEQGQMLAFEPPHIGENATLGGTLACNLSGPRRPHAGAARDFMLGCRIINGRGEILHFGGEVMKNVAGYDVSRLMCGALGTLGLMLEVSLKVLPRPEAEITHVMETKLDEALDLLHAWARLPLPISASCYANGRLYVRLEGAARAVEAASQIITGQPLADGGGFWRDLKEHRHGFFNDDRPLWRLSLASDVSPLDLEGDWLYEWGGAQRWLLSEVPAGAIREAAEASGGHATHYHRGPDRDSVFHPLPSALMKYHRQLKQAFDPQGLFNPGRMYPDF